MVIRLLTRFLKSFQIRAGGVVGIAFLASSCMPDGVASVEVESADFAELDGDLEDSTGRAIWALPLNESANSADAGKYCVISTEPEEVLLRCKLPAEYMRRSDDVLLVEDLDADGIRDLVLGAPDAHDESMQLCGAVVFVSGSNGGVLKHYFGPERGSFGYRILRAHDRDNDGFDDLIIGDPWNESGTDGIRGTVWLTSFATGETLGRYRVDVSNRNLGFSIERLQNNETGHNRYVVASHDPRSESNSVGGFTFLNEALEPVLRIQLGPGYRRRDSGRFRCTSVPDTDGDGWEDLLYSSPDQAPKSLTLLSGKTGELLYSVPPREKSGATFPLGGMSVDCNLDGVQDFFVGVKHLKDNQFEFIRAIDGSSGLALYETYLRPLSRWVMRAKHSRIVPDIDGDGVDDLCLVPQQLIIEDIADSQMFFYLSGRTGKQIQLH